MVPFFCVGVIAFEINLILFIFRIVMFVGVVNEFELVVPHLVEELRVFLGLVPFFWRREYWVNCNSDSSLDQIADDPVKETAASLQTRVHIDFQKPSLVVCVNEEV